MSSFGLLGYGYTGQRVNFNGNNTNPTTFTLPRDPGGPQGIMLQLNGIGVDEADYTLVGTTLTLNFPLRTGMKLKVIYLGLQAPLGIPAASNVDWANIVNIPATVYAMNRSALTHLLHPSLEGGWRDVYRAGWTPALFNQQWGASNWGAEILDEATSTLQKFEVATGSVDGIHTGGFGINTTYTSFSQGFVVSENMTPSAIWLRAYKFGNPVDNFVLQIYSDDGTGKPSTPLGSPISISGRILNTEANYKVGWTKFSGAFPALIAGTQYHIVTSRSGAIDANNYYLIRTKAFNRSYPHGWICNYNGSAWVTNPAQSAIFLVQSPNSSNVMQSGGAYGNAKMVFAPATAKNDQARFLRTDLKNFYDGRSFTAVIRGSAWAKGATLAEFGMGLNTNRIQITTHASTGAPIVNLFDASGNVYTVTGAVDVSGGNSDIIVSARTVGDGSDFLKLYVNGSQTGAALTAQTFVMDPYLRDNGVAYLGGGFTSPTWTSTTLMTSLPSTQGWTYTSPSSTAESAAFAIFNNRLFMNRNGIGATGSAYYTKTGLGLSNATGWSVEFKAKVTASNNNATSSNIGFTVLVADGTKALNISIQQFWLNAGYTSNNTYYQTNFLDAERTVLVCGKGSDYYVFVDNKLVIDGTGLLIDANATNQIQFGDINANSGENCDAVISAIRYSNNFYMPVATSGSISEYAYFGGDRTALAAALWNSGSPISVKEICGVNRNYLQIVNTRESRIRCQPASVSTTGLLAIPDMNCLVFGSSFDISMSNYGSSGGAMGVNHYLNFDGATYDTYTTATTVSSGQYFGATPRGNIESFVGLHSATGCWSSDASSTYTSAVRNFTVTSRG